MLHRTAYRVTGGRFGLSLAGGRVQAGMLRLTTIGRRTRSAAHRIIGYYEDGPNFVTLAMNGWAERSRPVAESPGPARRDGRPVR